MSGDVRLIHDPLKGFGDILLVDNDLDRDEGFETAVYISLFTDKRVDVVTALPSNSIDRRGWWADKPDFPWGSHLWLLSRETSNKEIVPKAEQYSKEALMWLAEEQIVESVRTSASLQRTEPSLILQATLIRKVGDPLLFRYYYHWKKQIARKI